MKSAVWPLERAVEVGTGGRRRAGVGERVAARRSPGELKTLGAVLRSTPLPSSTVGGSRFRAAASSAASVAGPPSASFSCGGLGGLGGLVRPARPRRVRRARRPPVATTSSAQPRRRRRHQRAARRGSSWSRSPTKETTSGDQRPERCRRGSKRGVVPCAARSYRGSRAGSRGAQLGDTAVARLSRITVILIRPG